MSSTCFFFFNDTATTEIYTLSLHDALPICVMRDEPVVGQLPDYTPNRKRFGAPSGLREDRKSTRLNSSHRCISYAVFCLKKKKKKYHQLQAETDKTTSVSFNHH